MLASSDERIRFEAGKYLTDRLYGKPSQTLQMNLNSDPSLAEHLEIARDRVLGTDSNKN
jgi:hypothetical protein